MIRPALMLAALTAPAHAQSFDDAVRANLAIGLQICLAGGSDMAAWVNTFRVSGFAERVERSATNSDTTHYFTAPAGTARVELYYGEQPEYCFVETDHMGVTDAAQILDGIVPRLYPGYVRRVEQGPIDPATGQPALCVRYENPASPIGQVIGVLPQGNGGQCINDGTSRFYSSYRV